MISSPKVDSSENPWLVCNFVVFFVDILCFSLKNREAEVISVQPRLSPPIDRHLKLYANDLSTGIVDNPFPRRSKLAATVMGGVDVNNHLPTCFVSCCAEKCYGNCLLRHKQSFEW
jgi:hypothetical protein